MPTSTVIFWHFLSSFTNYCVGGNFEAGFCWSCHPLDAILWFPWKKTEMKVVQGSNPSRCKLFPSKLKIAFLKLSNFEKRGNLQRSPGSCSAWLLSRDSCTWTGRTWSSRSRRPSPGPWIEWTGGRPTWTACSSKTSSSCSNEATTENWGQTF